MEVRELFTALPQAHPPQPPQAEATAPDLSGLREADQVKLEALRHDIQGAAADSLDRGEGLEIDWDAKLAGPHRRHATRHPTQSRAPPR